MANDLTGLRFGRLTVLSEAEPYIQKCGGKKRMWLCQCDCGNEKIVQGSNLTNGKTKSCGCLHRETSRENMLKWRSKHENKFLDLSGQKFGRLTVISYIGEDEKYRRLWKCKCECGKEVIHYTGELRANAVMSCGCLRDELIGNVNRKHGKSHKSRLYNVWVGMRQRCNDRNHRSYKNYGGRGISICQQWDDFAEFEKWAIASGYDEDASYGKCTLDRIDVNGNYSPENCRWVSFSVQAKNKQKGKHSNQ